MLLTVSTVRLIPVTQQPVQDNGHRGPDRQMIVCSRPGQRIQVKSASPMNASESPQAVPKASNTALASISISRNRGRTNCPHAPGRGDHCFGPAPSSSAISAIIGESGLDPDQFKCLPPWGCIFLPRRGPVVKNPVDQHHLVRQRGDDIIAPDPVGSAHPGDVVQVQVGYRRSDRFPVLVDHRIVNQGDV
jgi:hypothetical protein